MALSRGRSSKRYVVIGSDGAAMVSIVGGQLKSFEQAQRSLEAKTSADDSLTYGIYRVEQVSSR